MELAAVQERQQDALQAAERRAVELRAAELMARREREVGDQTTGEAHSGELSVLDTVAGSGSGLGRSGRGGRGRGEGRGGRGVRGGTSSSTACVAAIQVAEAATGSEVAAASSQPNHLPLAEVGDITGGNNVPESTLGGEATCIVCFARPKTHLAVPCGHQCACDACAGQMQACPYCRAPVQLWVQQRMV